MGVSSNNFCYCCCREKKGDMYNIEFIGRNNRINNKKIKKKILLILLEVQKEL